jgi:uncharacterized protein
MNIEFVLMGFLVGGLVGLTGVGGASLLTPLLIILGINPSMAIGTDFVYNSITKLAGTIQHVKQRTVDFKLVNYLAIGSVPGSILANLAVFSVLSPYYNKHTAMLILGVILILLSFLTAFQLFSAPGKTNKWIQKSLNEKRFHLIGLGFVVGMIVGATSVGAGSFTALILFYFFNQKSGEVVGTDIAHAFILVTVTGLLMIGSGHVNYLLAGNLLCGSIPGTIIGSKLSTKTSPAFLRIVMMIIIIISGLKLLFP